MNNNTGEKENAKVFDYRERPIEYIVKVIREGAKKKVTI